MSADTMSATERGLPQRRAVAFILLLGAISLFADMTYEGARSITGPYLGMLGVTATTIGIVSGFGELVGYAVRLGSGYLADRSGRYWAVTIFGYLLNLFAVPLLALAGNWQIAVVLIIAERMGRAVRSPPRDAMLSHAAGQTGLGWGFGLHQALDQTGAVIGPLVVSGILFLGHDYRAAFAVLLAPALVSISLVLAARMSFPRPHDFDLSPPALETAGLAPGFRVYLVAVAFIAAGYADFALIAYQIGQNGGDAGGLDPDRLHDRDGGRWCRRPGARIAIRPDRVAGDDPRDGHLGGAAPLVRRFCGGGVGHGVLGDRHRCPGIGHARDNRAAGTPRPACDGLWHFQRGLWYRLVCRQRPARHPLRPLDRRRGDRLDGIAGGRVAGLVPAGAPADRVIGVAPAPAMS